MFPVSQNPRVQSLTAVTVIVLGLAALAVSLPVTDHARAMPLPASPASPLRQQRMGWHPGKTLYAIDLPDEEPSVPAGPHQQQFTAVCRLCHSPRLVLNQPLLTEKKWAEVVHKMVVVYGAQLTAEEERNVVAYLVAVRGRAP